MDLILDIVRGREGLYKYLFYLGSFNKATQGLPASRGTHKCRRPPSPTAQLRPSPAMQGLCPWVSSSLPVLGWNSNLEEPFLPMTQSQSNHWSPALCRLRQTEAPAHTQEPWKTFQGRCLKSGNPPTPGPGKTSLDLGLTMWLLQAWSPVLCPVSSHIK